MGEGGGVVCCKHTVYQHRHPAPTTQAGGVATACMTDLVCRTIWQVWEAYSSSTSDSTAHDSAAADGMLHTAASAPAADGDIFVLTEALCTALAVLSDVSTLCWVLSELLAGCCMSCKPRLSRHLASNKAQHSMPDDVLCCVPTQQHLHSHTGCICLGSRPRDSNSRVVLPAVAQAPPECGSSGRKRGAAAGHAQGAAAAAVQHPGRQPVPGGSTGPAGGQV